MQRRLRKVVLPTVVNWLQIGLENADIDIQSSVALCQKFNMIEIQRAHPYLAPTASSSVNTADVPSHRESRCTADLCIPTQSLHCIRLNPIIEMIMDTSTLWAKHRSRDSKHLVDILKHGYVGWSSLLSRHLLAKCCMCGVAKLLAEKCSMVVSR